MITGILSFIAGGLTVWAVYNFHLQPKLKAERDTLVAWAKAKGLPLP